MKQRTCFLKNVLNYHLSAILLRFLEKNSLSKLFLCSFTCILFTLNVLRTHMGHNAHVKIGGQLAESVPFFHYVRPRVQTQTDRLGSKHLYSLPCFWFEQDLSL